MDLISKLCEWYERQCVDDWHEDHGILIDTLDNPGWSLKIDLDGTPMQTKPLEEIKIERSDHDWFVARRSGQIFEAFGGPRNLSEMIGSFLKWVEVAAD